VKSHYQPGAWKVQVETTDRREIGGSTQSGNRTGGAADIRDRSRVAIEDTLVHRIAKPMHPPIAQ
jgi:hypothetical protein